MPRKFSQSIFLFNFSSLGFYPDFSSTFSSTFEITESMLRFQLTEVGFTVVKALYRLNFGDAKRKAGFMLLI